MTRFVAIAAVSPSPSPTELDPAKVTPGIGGAVTFTVLACALALLLVSMNRHIKRIDFDEESTRQ